jgi:hypothetical protein
MSRNQARPGTHVISSGKLLFYSVPISDKICSAILVAIPEMKQQKLFFSTMLVSKGTPYFRSWLLDLVVEEYKIEIDITKEKN